MDHVKRYLPPLSRLLSLVLAVFLLVSCGTADTPASASDPNTSTSPSEETAVSPGEVKFPYDPGDSLNPYTCTTLHNYYLSGLIFDSLVVLNPTYQADLRLAQELVREENTWVARLRPDAVFSDGSSVTAADVLYSYQLATTNGRYQAALSQVSEVSAPDDGTVVFTLVRPDVFFDRSLVFPIVKLNTGELPVPMGGGRYILNSTGHSLNVNHRYYGEVENVGTIQLVESSDTETQSYGVMSKDIDLMYSDLQSELTLGLGTGHRQVQLSNLLFLGVNSSRSFLSNPQVRVALSSLLNRDDINRKTQMGFASTSDSLIRPAYGGSGASPQTAGEAAALLDSLGYGTRDVEGYRTTVGGQRLTLRILVNSENKNRVAAAELIAASLEQAGIKAYVDKVAFETYQNRIRSRDYDLYLGELRIPYNLDILNLISYNEEVGSGIATNPELVELYHKVKAGEEPVSALDTLCQQEMPVIPILYRRGIVCFSRDFSANIVATEQDIFYNIESW